MTDLFDLAEDLPEPLNDVSIDCRGLPFMPLHTARLKDSEFLAVSSGDEFKAGVMLWVKSWSEIPAGSLPDNDQVLAKATGYSLAHFQRLKIVAMRGFIPCSDGRLYHPAICDFAAAASRRRKNTAEAANTRWAAERKKRAGKSAKPATPRNARADAPAQGEQYKGEGESKGESPLPLTAEKPFSSDDLGGPDNLTLADYFEDQKNRVWTRYPQVNPPERRKAIAWHMAKSVLELYGETKAAAGKCVGEIVREYKLEDEDLADLALRVYEAKPTKARPFLIGCAKHFARTRDASAEFRNGPKQTPEEEAGEIRRQRQAMTDWREKALRFPVREYRAFPGDPGCTIRPEIQREFGVEPWTPPSAGEFA